MKPFSTFIIIIFAVLIAEAQKTDTIFFGPKYTNIDLKGHGVCVLYKYTGDTIYYRSQPYKINIPAKLDTSDIAFGYIYFTGWKNMTIDKISPVLVESYKDYHARIYVDKNQNMDFSDDGDPHQLNGKNDSIVISMVSSTNEKGLFKLMLNWIGYSSPESRKMTTDFFGDHPNGRKNTQLHSDYWLEDRRLNQRITKSVLNGDSVLIGIYDYDCNGLFNNTRDRVMIGDYATGTISDRKSQGAYSLGDTTIVKTKDSYFEITEIEETGSYLVIKPTDLRINKLIYGDTVPDLPVRLINDSVVSLHSLLKPGAYNLIDVWGTWCKGCLLQTPKLMELDSAYGQKLHIIALNFGNNKKQIQDYMAKNNIPWPNGYADDNIRSTFMVDGYPYLMLVGPGKRVIIMQASLKKIKEILATDKS